MVRLSVRASELHAPPPSSVPRAAPLEERSMISAGRIAARNVVGGLVAASILGAGFALAIEHGGGPPLSTTVGLVPAATSTATPTPEPGGGEPIRGIGGLGGYGLGAGEILGVVTKDTGQTPMQIMTSI